MTLIAAVMHTQHMTEAEARQEIADARKELFESGRRMNRATHIRLTGPAPDYGTPSRPPGGSQPPIWNIFAADREGRPVSRVYAVADYYVLALLLMRRIARDRGRMRFKVATSGAPAPAFPRARFERSCSKP